MSQTAYKYDVAFSFLQEDEQLAIQLNNRLKGRLATFIYTEQQLDLAGADGEQKFNDVFGQEARSVVVLYRDNWGSTRWTRIEQTAIRNRGFEEGYDFVLFVPLEKGLTPPKWLPKARIWIGLERWGLDAAAAFIEARVQELGGSPHEESVEELAARLQRQQEFSEQRRKFLDSEAAVQLANAEFGKLVSELKRLVEEIKTSARSFSFAIKEDLNLIVVRGTGRSLSFRWRSPNSNTVHGAKLVVAFCDGFLNVPGEVNWNEARETRVLEFAVDTTPTDKFGWRGLNEETRLFSTVSLVADCFKAFIQEVQDLRDEQERQR